MNVSNHKRVKSGRQPGGIIKQGWKKSQSSDKVRVKIVNERSVLKERHRKIEE